MKSSFRLVVIGMLSFACGGEDEESSTRSLPKGTSSLHVEIAGIRSGEGEVNCALWDTEEGFPGPSPLNGGAVERPAKSGSIWCVYESLPAGRYAVSAFHDENGNGTIDLSVVGAPKEGFGTTNNVAAFARPPTFEEAHVVISDGERVEKQITLRY